AMNENHDIRSFFHGRFVAGLLCASITSVDGMGKNSSAGGGGHFGRSIAAAIVDDDDLVDAAFWQGSDRLGHHMSDVVSRHDHHNARLSRWTCSGWVHRLADFNVDAKSG